MSTTYLSIGSRDTEHTQLTSHYPQEVCIPLGLSVSISKLAIQKGQDFGELAAELVGAGFNEIDDRFMREDIAGIWDEAYEGLSRWDESSSERGTLILCAHVYIRMRLTAKEYKKTSAETAALCLSYGLIKALDRQGS